MMYFTFNDQSLPLGRIYLRDQPEINEISYGYYRVRYNEEQLLKQIAYCVEFLSMHYIHIREIGWSKRRCLYYARKKNQPTKLVVDAVDIVDRNGISDSLNPHFTSSTTDILSARSPTSTYGNC